MQTRTLEVIVGLFVAAGLAALFLLAMQVSNLAELGSDDGFRITARFLNIGGLKPRSPVAVGGVRIGRVAEITYDQDTYEAVVAMDIASDYDRLPEDTTASIFTAGLLGENYVALEPGGSERFLTEGDEIQLTQSALVLEQIIGQFLFSKAAEGPPEGEPAPF
jgi:phospholipid/cholesterol/gamma-HCH transport system substrate-binding protein